MPLITLRDIANYAKQSLTYVHHIQSNQIQSNINQNIYLHIYSNSKNQKETEGVFFFPGKYAKSN